MRVQLGLLCLLLVSAATTSSFAFAANNRHPSFVRDLQRGGSRAAINVDSSSEGALDGSGDEVSDLKTSNESTEAKGSSLTPEKRPLKVLFLSSDTGGGHRASAEALGKQFLLQFPGSEYELVDLWTDHGCLPYRTLVNTYKHMSAHPFQWKLFYHLSNTRLNQVGADLHSKVMCGRKIKERIQSINPDVVVSVHPTMNYTPLIETQQISRELGKHIPFFTVVTDLGSGHCMWFQKNVDKLYVASDRLFNEARKRAGTPEENIVRSGLPIRHDFAVQQEKLGDRTVDAGKEYQKEIRKTLGIDPDKQVVLIMGGGEGVGSLSDIVDEMYIEMRRKGVDGTICVVCGRNEKLRTQLAERNWNDIAPAKRKGSRRKNIKNFFKKVRRSYRIEESLRKAEEREALHIAHAKGKVDVIGLGFVNNMAEYMAAADILVTKAGPGTIAEAASVGLPIMLTSFLPGQEAGNVEVVLEDGFGDYCEDPAKIANEVTCWLQDSDLLKTMSRAAQKAGNPYAADEIVQDIGRLTLAWMHANEQ